MIGFLAVVLAVVEDDLPVPRLRDAWYTPNADGSVRCWSCGKRFREHPNGTLVEDRG